MTTNLPVTPEQVASYLIERHIKNCQREEIKIDEAKLRELCPQLVNRVRDFTCVLKFGHSYSDLLAMGDPGFIKLVQLFGLSVVSFDGLVQRRCRAASLDGDRLFLDKLDEALKLQRDIDSRIKDDKFGVKAFLFLNWNTAFFIDNPPLRLCTNRQITELLEPYLLKKSAARFEVWDEERIKKEIHILRLRR